MGCSGLIRDRIRSSATTQATSHSSSFSTTPYKWLATPVLGGYGVPVWEFRRISSPKKVPRIIPWGNHWRGPELPLILKQGCLSLKEGFQVYRLSEKAREFGPAKQTQYGHVLPFCHPIHLLQLRNLIKREALVCLPCRLGRLRYPGISGLYPRW